MAKSKKPSKTVLEYRRVRKNLLQNVRRLEERGYDVSKIDVPDIPEKITRRDINALKKINTNRYKKSTYEVEVVKNKGRKNERIEVTKVSGEKYRKQERKQASEKAAATRRENKKLKEKPKIIDVGIGGITPPPIGETGNKPIENYGGDRGGDLESPDFGTWFNKETGELITGPRPYGDEWISASDAIRDYFDKSFESAMKRVEDMQVYEGKDKRARDIRSNADKIADKLRDEYARDPINTGKVIKEMEDMGLFEDVETWYFSGGYNKFVYNFNYMFNLFADYGAINDEDEYVNYDE